MSAFNYESLRDVRYKNGDLSQTEMALKLGISVSSYSNIESGKVYGNVKTWKRIQEVFKLTDDEVWRLMNRK